MLTQEQIDAVVERAAGSELAYDIGALIEELKARGEILDEIKGFAGVGSWLAVPGELRRLHSVIACNATAYLNAISENFQTIKSLEIKLAQSEECLRDIAWRHRFATAAGHYWTSEDFLNRIAEYFGITPAKLCTDMERDAFI